MSNTDTNAELKELLAETTSALGGTNNTYASLLKFLSNEGKLSVPNRLMPGQMIFFKYAPTNEAFLESDKYYDVFPLIFVTEVHRGGFEGINLHFVDIKRRMFLFNALMDQLPLKRNTEEWRNRLQMNYRILKAGKKFKFFYACYRKYSWGGMRKRPVVIPYENWKTLAESETGFFIGGRKTGVYRESANQIKRHNQKAR
jgi:hypothetical protein